jgi:iron complex outermembrane recepter protein
MRSILLLGAIAAVSGLALDRALAQTAPSEAGAGAPAKTEEIVVVGKRPGETAFDAPIAVTIVSAQTIRDQNLSSVRDFLQLVPTAAIADSGFGISQDIAIRGVGTPGLLTDPGVGVYIDDAYAGGLRQNLDDLYDLGSVQVLRGPQGGLYGRNAVGGAVNYVTAKPTDDWEEDLDFTYGSFERKTALGTINAPIVPGIVAVRANFWGTNQPEGEYFNRTLDRYIDTDMRLGGRFSISVKPTAEDRILLTAELGDHKGPENYGYFDGNGETPTTENRDTFSTTNVRNRRVTGQYDHDLGFAQFTLVSQYRAYLLNGQGDQDFTADNPPGALVKQVLDRDEREYNTFVEARLASPASAETWKWILGGTFIHDSGQFNTTDIFANDFNLPSCLIPSIGATLPIACNGSFGLHNDQKADSYSGFGELTYSLTDRLDLTGSLRYTRDVKSLDFVQTNGGIFALLGPFVGLPPVTDRESASFNNLSPGGSVSFKVTPDINTYIRINTGFRAGGYNSIITNPADLAYHSETSINYEAGAKTRWLDNKLDLNLSVFRLDQEHVLIDEQSLIAGYAPFLGNGSAATTYGVEVEGVTRPIRGMTLQAAAGWLDPELTNGTEDGEALGGKQIPYAPTFTFSTTASYRYPIADTYDLVGTGNFRFRSGGFEDRENTISLAAYRLVNTKLGIEHEGYGFYAVVDNLLDDQFRIADVFPGAPAPAGPAVTKAESRYVGLEVSARF